MHVCVYVPVCPLYQISQKVFSKKTSFSGPFSLTQVIRFSPITELNLTLSDNEELKSVLLW